MKRSTINFGLDLLWTLISIFNHQPYFTSELIDPTLLSQLDINGPPELQWCSGLEHGRLQKVIVEAEMSQKLSWRDLFVQIELGVDIVSLGIK